MTPAIAPGIQIGGYRIVRQIGAGGMGAVFLAEHVALGRRAAVKVLHQEYSRRPEIVTRFFNEARAATAINDPGIVQIFDFGQHDDGCAFIVMELLDGEVLDRRLQYTGTLSVTLALRIARQVATTLGAAHARGIVHRDLKPENIFLVRDAEVPGGERAKILDFGIAKLMGDTAGLKTQTSAVMGTPTYMSPEQCRGAGEVDQRSDVYSLGCVLYALIVGRPPFDADGVGEIIAMHLREPAPRASVSRPEIAPEVDQLIARCLEKDPARRFAHAGELAFALAGLLGSAPQLPATVIAGTGLERLQLPTTLSTASGANSQISRPRDRRWPWFAAGAVALATAAWFGSRRKPEVVPPPATAVTPVVIVDAASPDTVLPPADPRRDATPAARQVLGAIVAWSRDHDGAPCPDAATFASTPDPWQHEFAITCTDQPGDQLVGVISAGPDGIIDTADDIASWQLGREVTDLVRGRRWQVKHTPRPRPVSTPAPAPTPAPKPPVLQVDKYGLPISR